MDCMHCVNCMHCVHTLHCKKLALNVLSQAKKQTGLKKKKKKNNNNNNSGLLLIAFPTEAIKNFFNFSLKINWVIEQVNLKKK